MNYRQRTYCELCHDTGRVIVWHPQCLEAYRELRFASPDQDPPPTLPRRDHRSCAVACHCGSGAPFRWLPTYNELAYVYYHTLADERDMALFAWFDERFANTVEIRNGVQMESRY